MGTETFRCSFFSSFFCVDRVKLNDPLMGTETHQHVQSPDNSNGQYVKLNDPLMGTET